MSSSCAWWVWQVINEAGIVFMAFPSPINRIPLASDTPGSFRLKEGCAQAFDCLVAAVLAVAAALAMTLQNHECEKAADRTGRDLPRRRLTDRPRIGASPGIVGRRRSVSRPSGACCRDFARSALRSLAGRCLLAGSVSPLSRNSWEPARPAGSGPGNGGDAC